MAMAASSVSVNVSTGERERESQRRKKEEGGGVALLNGSRGSSRRLEVGGGIGVFLRAPRTCSQCPSEEDKDQNANSPLALVNFHERTKQHPFV
jgi:hypothetical protein